MPLAAAPCFPPARGGGSAAAQPRPQGRLLLPWHRSDGGAFLNLAPPRCLLRSLTNPAGDRVRQQQYQVDIGTCGTLRCAFSGTQDLLFLLLQREVGIVDGCWARLLVGLGVGVRQVWVLAVPLLLQGITP